MSGNANSGRKPKSLNREQAMRSLTLKLPKAINVIGDTMEGHINDRLRYEAAISIKDSVMGKPKQQTELTGGGEIGTGMVVEVLKLMASERRKLLEEGNYAAEQGEASQMDAEIQG